MNTRVIYVLSVLIWGSTWLAISYQLGVVALEVSVFYRYGAASVLLLTFCVLTSRPLRYNLAQHRLFAGVGLLMFCINYLMAYAAQEHISSALNALIYSCIVWMNIVNARIFLKVRSSPEVLGGAVLGMLGIGILFWPSLSALDTSHTLLIGGAMATLGALSASFGNVLSQHALTHLPVVQVNAWGMTYGALFNLLVCLALGREFTFDLSTGYVGSMLFLIVGGSIAGFVLYLTLIGRLGANRAGYVVVAFPVVATVLAVIFEGLKVTGWLFAGMVLVLLGNVLILNQGRQIAVSEAFSGNEKST
ncbi:MAG: DMT family transporter [Lysobacterales bacterium]